MKWKQDPIDSLCFDHSAIWGEHPGVYIIVYEHNVHLKKYELSIINYTHTHTTLLSGNLKSILLLYICKLPTPNILACSLMGSSLVAMNMRSLPGLVPTSFSRMHTAS